jgi:hypothetical protein
MFTLKPSWAISRGNVELKATLTQLIARKYFNAFIRCEIFKSSIIFLYFIICLELEDTV